MVCWYCCQRQKKICLTNFVITKHRIIFMNVPISMPSTFPVTCHTDFVGKDSIFVAIEGYADNGVNYIKKAIEKGARTIVVHHNTFLDDELRIFMCAHDVVVERVDNTRKA